jgi:hypothetical protein
LNQQFLRRLYKNWYRAKGKAFTRYSKLYADREKRKFNFLMPAKKNQPPKSGGKNKKDEEADATKAEPTKAEPKAEPTTPKETPKVEAPKEQAKETKAAAPKAEAKAPAKTSNETAKHPLCKWAESSDAVFLTIEVNDVKDPVISITDNVVSFESNGYKCDLKLKKDIDPKDSKTKYVVTGREVVFHLVKKEAGRWQGLLADKNLGRNLIKPDFDKWIDSDDDEKDAGGFDMSSFGGGGGFGGGGFGGGGGDMSKMMEMMKGMKGGEGDGDDDDEPDAPKGGDEEEEDMPDLESSAT